MICDVDTDMELVKAEGPKKVMMGMLTRDPEKRMELDQILKDDWVTNNGQDTIDLKEVDHDELDNTGKKGFGNIQRLLKSKALGQGATSKQLVKKKSASSLIDLDEDMYEPLAQSPDPTGNKPALGFQRQKSMPFKLGARAFGSKLKQPIIEVRESNTNSQMTSAIDKLNSNRAKNVL